MTDNTSYDIIHAIIALDPSANISVVGEDHNQISWGERGNPLGITIDQIKEKQAELQAEYDAQDYARNRQAEYPSVDDLIVALWENVVEERASAVVSLEADRQAVKTKYPKP